MIPKWVSKMTRQKIPATTDAIAHGSRTAMKKRPDPRKPRLQSGKRLRKVKRFRKKPELKRQRKKPELKRQRKKRQAFLPNRRKPTLPQMNKSMSRKVLLPKQLNNHGTRRHVREYAGAQS